MKILYKRRAKVYTCLNYYRQGEYTSHCLFYKGRVIRSAFVESGNGHPETDWTKKGYDSDPWKGNTWRNLHSSGFDMDHPQEVSIYVDERDIEYKHVLPAQIPYGQFIEDVAYVWREVGGTQEYSADDVKLVK
jgi:hypothetical protein